MRLGSHFMRKVTALPDALLDRLRPQRPHDFLGAQPKGLAEHLPYVEVLELDRPTCLLADGSLGIVWELEPVGHEALDLDETRRIGEGLAKVFSEVRDPRVTFQIIHDSEPSADFLVPGGIAEPRSAAERLLAKRVDFIRSLAEAPRERVRLMRRRVFLSLRISDSRSVAERLACDAGSELASAGRAFGGLSRELGHLATSLEDALGRASIRYAALDGRGLLELLRASLHGMTERRQLATLEKGDEARSGASLRSQILRDFAAVTPRCVGVGDDSWEVCSWLDQPPIVFDGLWAHLLALDVPHRLVVNIRPESDTSSLDTKASLLRHANDAFGSLQREEIRYVQDALARGDVLLSVSIHLFVRNVGVHASKLGNEGLARSVISKLKASTQVPFIIEKLAAPAIFLLSLPLAFGISGAGITGRERRVLSRNMGPYLPIWGAFRGTRGPLQLMVSRGGEACWLSPFDAETSPHVAVLASSGAGKSFYAQNLMASFMARYARDPGGPLLFVVDKKTSYEIFAKVLGEELGCQIVKPPSSFPNVFRGQLDEMRLAVIVGLLEAAVSMVSPDHVLGAVEETLIAASLRRAFEACELEARTVYVEGQLSEREIEKLRIPRLSDIVDALPSVAAELGVDRSKATRLAVSFAPFIGNGPYSPLFDRYEFDSFDPPTPGVSLYDVDAVAGNSVLASLTTQVILAEILRQIRRPENRGRPAMLVIEEVGVLAGSSPEIVSFIQDAWKTFRKLGVCCVGLTNEVDDYAQKPGCREIWNVSPNKVLLRLLVQDLQKARAGVPDRGIPPLIASEHASSLVGSLSKVEGAYSQGMWWSDEACGTFVYQPTGHDYWCAASRPIEVETVELVREHFGCSYFDAVDGLAQMWPKGVRDESGSLRRPTAKDLRRLGEVMP